MEEYSVSPTYHATDRAKIIKILVDLPVKHAVDLLIKPDSPQHIPKEVYRWAQCIVIDRNDLLRITWDVYGIPNQDRRSVANCRCEGQCPPPSKEADDDVRQVYEHICLTDQYHKLILTLDPWQDMDVLIGQHANGIIDPKVINLTLRPNEVLKVRYIIAPLRNVLYDHDLAMVDELND